MYTLCEYIFSYIVRKYHYYYYIIFTIYETNALYTEPCRRHVSSNWQFMKPILYFIKAKLPCI